MLAKNLPMVSNITMKKEQYITVHDLKIRVRPVPHWDHDPSKNGGFYTTLLVGGGNGIHLGGYWEGTFESAQEIAQWLLDNPAEYADIHADLVRSNRPISQSYLDMCRGQEL